MSSKLCPFCMRMTEEETCPHCGKNVNYKGKPANLPAGYVVSGRHPYVLGAALGQGGFGITYIALDMVTNERVAIKEYYPTYCSVRSNASTVDPYANQEEVYFKGKERFLDEARTLKSLSDLKSIVNVLDFFEANNTAYLVMEFLDGQSLKEHAAKNGKFPAGQFLDQIRPLMEDIHRMHERGVIHRDIAPDNIVLQPDGQMKLIDFGAARSFVGDKSMTVVVKKGFAPVEQYMSKGSTAATDVYALAATIYYCITGRVPPDSAARQYDNVPLEAPSAHGADLAPQQEKALLKALEIQQKDRTQSVQAFLDNLRVRKPVQQKTVQKKPVQKETIQQKLVKQKTETQDSKVQDEKEPLKPSGRKWIPVIAAVAILVVLILVMSVLPNSRQNNVQIADAPSSVPSEPTNTTVPVTEPPSTIPSSQTETTEPVPSTIPTIQAEPWEQNVLRADPLSALPQIKKPQIQNVTFLDTCADAPEDAWDVSETKDRSVLAWAKENDSMYDVWFAAEGGINAVNACSSLFLDCTSLESVEFGNAFHTDYAANMYAMFKNCSQLTEVDVGGWNTACVTNMRSMFQHCTNLTTLDVSGWDTSYVTDMSSMFCMPLGSTSGKLKTLDVSGWDTSCVTDMSLMFYYCRSLTMLDVSRWDTSCVTNMSYMFYLTDLTTLDVSGWNTSCVTDMSAMFCYTDLTTLDVSGWDTSRVTDMRYMFASCRNLAKLNVSNWDTSNVTDMSYMFENCIILYGLNIDNWDVSNVTNYEGFMPKDKGINGRKWIWYFTR